MADADVTIDKSKDGARTARLSAQPVGEVAGESTSQPQGFTIYDAMLLGMAPVLAGVTLSRFGGRRVGENGE